MTGVLGPQMGSMPSAAIQSTLLK